MHLFYNASQNYKIGYLELVDLSAIFLASPLSILAWELLKANGMALQSCSILFREPIDLLLSCLSQTKHPNAMSTAC